MLLGESQQLSHVLSGWRQQTSVESIQFAVRLKPIVDPHDLEAAGSGLVRVYHKLYGDYESYLGYIVTPVTEVSQVMEQAVVQLSPSENPGSFELVLKTGTIGKANLFLCSCILIIFHTLTYIEVRRTCTHVYITVFAQSKAAATIYFMAEFCSATYV